MLGTPTTQCDAQNARHLISVPKGLGFFPNKHDLLKVL